MCRNNYNGGGFISNIQDLTGKTFGRLYVIKRNPNDYITPSTGKHTPRWDCVCRCGETSIVTSPQLKFGRTQSCGCLQRERAAKANTTHGGRYERLHQIWSNMKNRCYNPKYAEHKNYKDRGISVCEEWLEYESFRKWALSNGYDDSVDRGELTLDRIDVDKGYYPDNCRFVDMFVQANNKTNNIKYTIHGIERTLSEWADFYDVPYNKLYYQVRTKGLSIEKVIMAMRHNTRF